MTATLAAVDAGGMVATREAARDGAIDIDNRRDYPGSMAGAARPGAVTRGRVCRAGGIPPRVVPAQTV